MGAMVGKCRRLPLLLLLFLLLSIILCMVINQKTYLSAVSNNLTTFHSAGFSAAADGGRTNSDNQYYDDADFIVRHGFQQSYAHLLPCDDNPSWMKAAETTSIAKICTQQTRDYITSENVTVPWWFQTLLRDITSRAGGGVYVPWHHFYTTKPLLNFCTIDKVATTEWRKVFCELNKADCVNNTNRACNKRKCTYRTLQTMPTEAPWAVFVRDPLERLLSGFLDKCFDATARIRQGHCEPNVVFNPKKGLDNYKNIPYPNLLESIEVEGKGKLMFEAWVDVMPLKWNEHFVPQALHCDLYRNIGKYHFVGKMGKDFYFDLDRMANRFGGQLPEILNNTFGYMDHVKNENHENTGKQGSQHAKLASEKVMRFYSARTVRKALEYLSIDYVTLGLDVPEWARQMLKNETS